MEKSVDSGGLKRTKMLVIILLVVVLILTAAVVFIIVKDNGSTSSLIQMFKSDEEYTFLLDEFSVNLKQDKSKGHYLKLKIALMSKDKKAAKTIDPNINKIRDSVIGILRNKTYEDIADNNVSADIKKEITDSLNQALGKDIINDIYITDILVQ